MNYKTVDQVSEESSQIARLVDQLGNPLLYAKAKKELKALGWTVECFEINGGKK